MIRKTYRAIKDVVKDGDRMFIKIDGIFVEMNKKGIWITNLKYNIHYHPVHIFHEDVKLALKNIKKMTTDDMKPLLVKIFKRS